MDTSYNCVICLKDLNMNDGVLTPCGHRYHSDCFFKWIYKKKTNEKYRIRNCIEYGCGLGKTMNFIQSKTNIDMLGIDISKTSLNR